MRSLPPLPCTRTVPCPRSTSSTSRRQHSSTRRPVAYSSSSRASARRPPVVDRRRPIQQVLRLVLGQDGGQDPRRARAPHLPGRVPIKDAVAGQEAKAASQGGEPARDRGAAQPAPAEPGEVRADEGGVAPPEVLDPLVPGPRAELTQVARVRAQGVGRGAPLSGQVLQKGADRVVRACLPHRGTRRQATPGASACLNPHSSRTQERVRRPSRATRSVRNGAWHCGQASGTGRAQTENLQFG